MNMPWLFLLLQAASTWFMVGLIWLVQIVHYPLFALVGPESYSQYQQQHQWLITWIVAPVMSVELIGAIWLAAQRPPQIPATVAWTGLALVVVIWGSTALLQVPCHARLLEGFDAVAHRQLVQSNWIRTIAWSLRGMLVGWMLFQWARSAG